MDALVNLKREPELREALDYSPVHNNTVLIDCRTKWGNPFRIGPSCSREQAVARYREDLWRRIRAGEVALEQLAELDGCWRARRHGPPKYWRSGPMRDAAPCSGRRRHAKLHRRWGCAGGEHSPRCDVPLCHTCSVRQRLRRPPLRSGRDSE